MSHNLETGIAGAGKTRWQWAAEMLHAIGVFSLLWGLTAPLLAIFFTGGTEVFSWSIGGKFVLTRAGAGILCIAASLALRRRMAKS